MRKIDVPEEYVTFVQVLADDARLRHWFEALSSLPADMRSWELRRVAEQFQAAGQESLAHLVRSLNDDRIYGIVKAVTSEFRQR